MEVSIGENIACFAIFIQEFNHKSWRKKKHNRKPEYWGLKMLEMFEMRKL